MPIQNLPSGLQSLIQQGFLDHEIRAALKATLGFRRSADRVPFRQEIGQTITYNREALLPAVTTPTSPLAITDVGNLTGANIDQTNAAKNEQYTLSANQYNGSLSLNTVTSKVAIGDRFLQDAKKLTEQAARSIDGLARNELYNTYMGGHSWVTTGLTAAGTSVRVDDVRGFHQTLNSLGQPAAVSATNPAQVLVGGDTYTLVGVVADGFAPVNAPITLAYSGAVTGIAPINWGAVPGTLIFAANVSTTDGALNATVIRYDAPHVIRPDGSASTLLLGSTSASAFLTVDAVLAGAALLKSNGVEPIEATGLFGFYASPQQLTGLYKDPSFQNYFKGRPDSEEFRRGALGELLGVEVIRTNQNPVQAPGNGINRAVHRGIIVGQGALMEADFGSEAYASALEDGNGDGMLTVVDGIAHTVRSPIDVALQSVTQTWSYIGGFCAPSDWYTTPAVLPTATAAGWKRSIVLESF